MAVIEKESGRLLYSFNENEKLPMASTTKIITAIFVIENCKDLDAVVEISKQAVGIEGTSIGLKEGEHLTIRELLYGLMLRSGNDSAVMLALAVCGSLENFNKQINEYVRSLGALNTNLENPHGLPNDNHYTTATDLALISAHALKNPVFQEIVSTKRRKISNELNSKYSRDLVNKNRLLTDYGFADGVKTGFTKKAGRCFVGSATKNDMQLVCVLLNCGPMFEECEALLEKGFNEYKLTKILEKGQDVGSVQIKNSSVKKIDLQVERYVFYPLKDGELKNIKMKVEKPKVLKAPLKKGEEVASLAITLENQLIFSQNFYTINSVESNAYQDKIVKIMQGM